MCQVFVLGVLQSLKSTLCSRSPHSPQVITNRRSEVQRELSNLSSVIFSCTSLELEGEPSSSPDRMIRILHRQPLCHRHTICSRKNPALSHIQTENEDSFKVLSKALYHIKHGFLSFLLILKEGQFVYQLVACTVLQRMGNPHRGRLTVSHSRVPEENSHLSSLGPGFP